jgi:glutathione synthase/RimK-type ligase-like ATP-grasp enzyme
MKIGYVIGPQGFKWQDTYFDKFPINHKLRPWLTKVPVKFYVDEDGHDWKKDMTKKQFVRIDVAVGYGLKYYIDQMNGVTLELIPAENLSVRKLNQFDLVINQFMDLLIVPFMKQFEQGGVPHKKLLNIYENTKTTLYPPFEYHKLIIDKCKYYAFLKSKGVSISPTMCVKKTEYIKNPKKSIEDLIAFIQTEKLNKVFTKPVHGTDSTGIKLFNNTKSIAFKKQIKSHIDNLFKGKRYPGMVVQKYAKDFEKRIPQARLFFIGNKHLYTVLTKRSKTFRPQSETPGSEKTLFPVPMKCLVKRANSIIRIIKKEYFGKMPMLLTRVDFGCCLKTVSKDSNKQCLNFFINEIEFNGGNYVHMDNNKERRFMYDKKIIQQLIKVIKYKQKK